MNAALAAALLLAEMSGAVPFAAEVDAALAATASVYPVPRALVFAVMRQESSFDPKARSSAGAIGLMQVMPFNATKLGLASPKELWVPRLNILAGVRLLAALLKHYEGDVIASLVAYNSGPNSRAVVPDNGETPAYVVAILKFWRELEGQGGTEARAVVGPRLPSSAADGGSISR